MAGQISAGDVGTVLSFTVLSNSNDSAFNLTGATVTLIVSGSGTRFTRPCVIDSGLNGECHYTIASGDTFSTGLCKLQLQIALSGQQFTTVDQGLLQVLPTL